MALDLIKPVLQAEAAANDRQKAASQQAQAILEEARRTAQIMEQATLQQAQNEAQMILSEADYTADGILKQAEKLSEMRRGKVISTTEKKYDEAIRLILDTIAE